MTTEVNKEIKDIGSERALISTIIKNGKDSFVDAAAYVSSNDLSLPINRHIYQCLESLANDPNITIFDTDTIKLRARTLGIKDCFTNKKDIEYLDLLNVSNFSKENINVFAKQVRKVSIVRDLYKRYKDAATYIEGINGSEPLSEIISKAEEKIVDFIAGTDSDKSLDSIGKDMENYVQFLLDRDEVDQVGIPSGFPTWDHAIGGGLRRAAIQVVAARAKTGKSFVAMNFARSVAKRGIPTLYLDTEMTTDHQKDRLLAMDSGCPIRLLETSQFKTHNDLVEAIKISAENIKQYPLTHVNIGGMGHVEALALARRWIVKVVGFNENGKANDCVIIYDYMKLTSGDNLTKFTPEYILLGLMLTDMHNFALKYDIPILGFVQTNREGIDNDDTSIIAGSDRILWLCSSMSVLRNKDINDEEGGDGFVNGNKKLSVLETRYGSGLEYESDYINLHAQLRPRVDDDRATGHIREGLKHSEIVRSNAQTTK